jgi:hypothetical protein
MPLEIGNQQSSSRDGIKPAEQSDHLLIFKMVQEQRRRYKVKASGRERKPKGIRDNLGLRRQSQVHRTAIETGDRRSGIIFLNEPRSISGSRANVEQGEVLVAAHHAVQYLSQDRMPAEISVDADQVFQIRPRLLRSQVVQHFRLNEPFAKHGKW